MLSFLGHRPFCHLPSPALLSLFGRFLVKQACWCTPILGINAMSAGLHCKQYYQEDGLCATVIVTSVCLGPSRTMTSIRWLILFVLISAWQFSYLCKLAPVVVCSIIIMMMIIIIKVAISTVPWNPSFEGLPLYILGKSSCANICNYIHYNPHQQVWLTIYSWRKAYQSTVPTAWMARCYQYS